jgi:hypothetical protein
MKALAGANASEGDIQKRACTYNGCDDCYTRQTQCANFNRNEDCLSCALSWCVYTTLRFITLCLPLLV